MSKVNQMNRIQTSFLPNSPSEPNGHQMKAITFGIRLFNTYTFEIKMLVKTKSDVHIKNKLFNILAARNYIK